MYGSAEGFLFMKWTDLVVTPLYILLFFRIIVAIINRYYPDPEMRTILLRAFWIKVIGSIAVSCIYEFYYKGGDVEGYFWGSRGIYNSLFENPIVSFKLLFLTPAQILKLQATDPDDAQLLQYIVSKHFLNTQELTAIKVAGFVSYFCMHTYTAMAMFFAMFSFAGSWKLYFLMIEEYPKLKKEMAVACFYIPSVVFWGSGVLKDPITYAGVCFIVYYMFDIFVKYRFSIFKLFFLFLNIVLVLSIKPYIFLCLLPGVLLFLLLTNVRKIQSPILTALFAPFLLILFGSMMYLMANVLREELGRYALANITETLESFQEWHAAEAKLSGGSGYTLGDMDYSTWGIIKKFPLAINVTFFRPYLWEARKPVIFISALESLFVTLFVIRIMIRTGLRGFFRTVLSDPFILFCMMFSIIFGFAVGMSSYNFGALVRYKIPCMSFFVIGLYLINYREAERKKKSKLKKQSKLT